MGAEIESPLVNEQVLRHNFTNEGGVGGTVRFLKNIMGLWLVQECRRTWERAGKTYTYEELVRLAEAAPPFVSLVDPDRRVVHAAAEHAAGDCRFLHTHRPDRARRAGAVVRCALESLALKYRWVLERLEELLGRRLDTIHIVGGGSQNALLCQLTADACNRPVMAGPVEATAIGNVVVQAMGLGLLGSLAEAREVVRQSFEVKEFEPRQPHLWDDAYGRLVGLVV